MLADFNGPWRTILAISAPPQAKEFRVIDIVFTIFWVLVAIGFYRIRCSKRFVYGLIEIIAGVVTIVLGEFPPYSILTDDGSSVLGTRAAHILTLMAGVYIVVRGLDNMAQDLPHRWRPAWRRIFGI